MTLRAALTIGVHCPRSSSMLFPFFSFPFLSFPRYVAAWEALCAKRAARKKRKKKAPAAGTLVQVKKVVTPEERAHLKGKARLQRRVDRRQRVEDRLRARADALQGPWEKPSDVVVAVVAFLPNVLAVLMCLS